MNTRNKSKNMERRDFMKISGGLLLGTMALSRTAILCDQATGKYAQPTNVVLIMTDQQTMDTISAGGCEYLETPALDKLIKRGVSFKQSYSNNPVCSPARSAIFTGRPSSETGVYRNGRPIRDTMPNIGQWLRKKTDYETVYTGKWHLPGSYTKFIPGFRVINTGRGGMGYINDATVSRACEGYILNRDRSNSFFLVASYMQPHDICEWLRLNTEVPEKQRYPELVEEYPPLPANFEYDGALPEPKSIIRKRRTRDPSIGNWDKNQWRYYRWSYYRHIEMVDHEVGKILQALEDSGREKETLIIFTSDHGEGMGHHQMVRKSTFYEETISVPLIFSWPGRIPEGKTDRTHLVSGLDIFPTICDYLNIEPPPEMRGMSLKPILENEKTEGHEFIVSEVSSNTGRMVRTKEYKYIVYKDDTAEQLFNMQQDADETKNLAKDPRYAGIIQEHREMLKEWEQKLDVAPEVPETDTWWYNA